MPMESSSNSSFLAVQDGEQNQQGSGMVITYFRVMEQVKLA